MWFLLSSITFVQSFQNILLAIESIYFIVENKIVIKSLQLLHCTRSAPLKNNEVILEWYFLKQFSIHPPSSFTYSICYDTHFQ